jgi:hypothetical protein
MALGSAGGVVLTDVDVGSPRVCGLRGAEGHSMGEKALEQTELQHDLCSSGQLSVGRRCGGPLDTVWAREPAPLCPQDRSSVICIQ